VDASILVWVLCGIPRSWFLPFSQRTVRSVRGIYTKVVRKKDMTISKNITKFISKSPSRTEHLGKKIAETLLAGDVIGLYGELGAGKTTLVRGLVVGLGADESTRVTSPSYVLLNIYRGRLPVYHFDFYRLIDPDSILELGCEEYFGCEGVSVVEWADRAEQLLSPEALKINMAAVDATTRRISVIYPDKRILRV